MTYNLRVRLITWNVGNSPPPKDLSELLGLQGKNLPNVYAIGLQEIPGVTNVLSNSWYEDSWTPHLTEILAERNFVRVQSTRMVGISLLVFVSRQDVMYVTNVEAVYTRTGFSGYWGNKGGVSIRMDISGVNICFVNCHLAAHHNETERRIQDYIAIIENQRFQAVNTPSILDHDYVFWLGDLNFRLTREITYDQVLEEVKKDELKKLWKYDQLKQVMKDELMLLDFTEGNLDFPPTYKFDVGTDVYDTSSKKRKPAWCDRILWMCHDDSFVGADLSVQLLSYTSHPAYRNSDHKPVSAECLVTVLYHPPELPVMFEPIEMWSTQNSATCTYVVVNELSVSAWDWIGLYKLNYQHELDYVTYSWASVTGEDMGDGSEMYMVDFPKNTLSSLPHDYYCLHYMSSRKSCTVGYSDAFRITDQEEMSSGSSSSSSSSGRGGYSSDEEA
ncbi:Inositol polyphosphate 5-phosphatase K [Lamellibrachia satsuma]|nr:Inositol polyphosphate 5-phosphatase K [Lamellibrachia satsuma]